MWYKKRREKKRKEREYQELCRIIGNIKKQQEQEKQAITDGKNKYLQLEARVTDPDTGKRTSDLPIYGMRVIETQDEAEDFIRGYIKDIFDNPEKHPETAIEDPTGYVISDLWYVLGYFPSKKYHELWTPTFEKIQKS